MYWFIWCSFVRGLRIVKVLRLRTILRFEFGKCANKIWLGMRKNNSGVFTSVSSTTPPPSFSVLLAFIHWSIVPNSLVPIDTYCSICVVRQPRIKNTESREKASPMNVSSWRDKQVIRYAGAFKWIESVKSIVTNVEFNIHTILADISHFLRRSWVNTRLETNSELFACRNLGI